MDDDEIEVEETTYATARRHNKWSVVVLGLNYLTRVSQQTSNFVGELTIAAAQHANQVEYDKKFDNMTRLMQWEKSDG